MAYQISLLIDGKTKNYISNEPPTFQDLTSALIIQDHQVGMDPGAYMRAMLYQMIQKSSALSADDISGILKQYSETFVRQPTADEQLKNMNLIAEFANHFWGNQFTKEDVINGATQEAVDVINDVIAEALGNDADDDDKKADDATNPKE